MVALPCPTVAPGSVNMVAWALWTLLLLSGLLHAHASGLDGGRRFSGDVSDDEVIIDKLKDFWNSRQRALHHLGPVSGQAVPSRPRHQLAPALSSPPAPSRLSHQKSGEKIQFAVTPKDPRYYLPATPPRHDEDSATAAEILPYYSPDLSLAPRLDYPGDLLQYPDDDLQYPSEYPGQYRPQYPQQEPRRPSYLSRQDLPYPALYPPGLQDPRLLREDEVEEEEEAVRGEVDAAREAFRKGLLDEGDYAGDDSQLMMKKGEIAGEEEAVKDDKDVDAEALTSPPPANAATSQPETMNYMHLRRAPVANQEAAYIVQHPPGSNHQAQLSDLTFTALVAGCTAVAVCGVVGAGLCWYRLNKSHRAAQDAEYPAYGVTGPNKDLSPSGDRKLAQSAHMYHYQHQKQQMIALEKSSGGERHGSTSDVDSEEEGEENEYTVYECPGLAPTGEMEVKNPLFHDDPTPATPSIRKEAEQNHHDHHDEDTTTK